MVSRGARINCAICRLLSFCYCTLPVSPIITKSTALQIDRKMLSLSFQVWALRNATATLPLKRGPRLDPCLLNSMKLTCVWSRQLFVASSTLQFPPGGPATSSFQNVIVGLFMLWQISLIELSLRQDFVTACCISRLVSSVLVFSRICRFVQVTAHVLTGLLMKGFVVELPAVCWYL